MREMIEDYLDDALDAAGRRHVETAVATDPATAALLRQLKDARALRAQAYASYMPAPAEASALASSILAACANEEEAPVAGRIGPRSWTRILSGIAAGLAIAIGAFAVGRTTAPVQTQVIEKLVSAPAEKVTEYQVVYLEAGKDAEVVTYASREEFNDALRQAMQRGSTVERNGGFYAVASIEAPGKM